MKLFSKIGFSLGAILLGVLCLGGLESKAQDEDSQGPPPEMMGMLAEAMQSENMQRMQKASVKQAFRMYWDGKGANLGMQNYLMQPAFREGLGITDEQMGNIQKAPMELMQDEKFSAAQKEIMELVDIGDPFFKNAGPEKVDKLIDIQGRMMDGMFEAMSNKIDEVLTPEQKKLSQEAQLSMMSEVPIISPSMFEVLDLDDEQKKQMAEIKKEFDGEFDEISDKFTDDQLLLTRKIFEYMAKEKTGFSTDPSKNAERVQDMLKKMAEEDPEFREIQRRSQEYGQQFVTKFKYRLYDILSDEQLKRLIDLTENPPEYIKKMKEMMKELRGEKSDAPWKPSLDSWKPGDPVPEEYKQKRNISSFPSEE